MCLDQMVRNYSQHSIFQENNLTFKEALVAYFEQTGLPAELQERWVHHCMCMDLDRWMVLTGQRLTT
jgi:hypothetical protein